MAAVPFDPATFSIQPGLVHTHGSHVANATEVSQHFGTRHAGCIGECAAAWGGAAAEALAELSAHWETSDAQLHGRVGAFSAAMREGAQMATASEEKRAFAFTPLRQRSGAS